MARLKTPQDAHALVNLLAHQLTGCEDLTATDTSSFVSVGETILTYPIENVMNTLGMLVTKTMIDVQPYDEKLKLIDESDMGEYSNIVRTISFYSKDAKASGDWNTQLHTNLAMGFDNGSNPNAKGDAQSTASMWEQNPAVPLEMNFGGLSVWEDSMTFYKRALKQAFRNEQEFNDFINGQVTEKSNDMKTQKESFNRVTLLNFMGGLVDLDASDAKGRVVNLTAAFNAKFGTSYTSAQLRTTHLADFMKFFTSVYKQYARRLTYRQLGFHWSPAKKVDGVDYYLLRSTPYTQQKAFMYGPLFDDARAQVFPEIFHDEYLLKENFEEVDFWQAYDNTNANDVNASINVVPAIPTNTGEQTAGAAVSLDYVVGMIFDKRALATHYSYEDSEATPIEARKRFWNIWYSMGRNSINNFTHNAVLFIMKDQ